MRAGGRVDAAHQREHERDERRGVFADTLDLLKLRAIGGKHRVERAEFFHQPVRDGVRVLPRHGVIKEKLEHLMVGERIKPVGAELLFFARAMSFVYRHVCSPFRGVFAAKRGSLLLFLS